MDALEQLSRRVQQAAEEILSLKRERGHLLSEIEALKDQLRSYKINAREGENYEREKTRLRSKLEKLRSKIEKLMVSEPPIPASPASSTKTIPTTSKNTWVGDLFDEKHN